MVLDIIRWKILSTNESVYRDGERHKEEYAILNVEQRVPSSKL